MRDIQQPFDDAYVEFVGLRCGMGAVPYVPESWFDYIDANPAQLPFEHYFSNIWFQNKILAPTPPSVEPHNYFHLIGASSDSNMYGGTFCQNDWTYLFEGKLETDFTDPAQRVKAAQWVCDHEMVHQFNVNPEVRSHHDSRIAWCDGDNHCEAGGTLTARCLMNVDPTDYAQRIVSGVARLDTVDLLTGPDPSAGVVTCSTVEEPWNQGDGAVRVCTDPH